jgi:hypothetical protein
MFIFGIDCFIAKFVFLIKNKNYEIFYIYNTYNKYDL